MQFRITASDIDPDGTTITFADMMVNLQGIHPDVAVNWASSRIDGLVEMYNAMEEEDDDSPPLHEVVLTGVGTDGPACIKILIDKLNVTEAIATDIVGTANAGGSFILKTGLSAKDAMDLSDEFANIGCVVSIRNAS